MGKTKAMRSCLFIAVLLSWFTLISHASESKQIIIAGDSWCPINCGEQDQNKGFMIDVATDVFADLGYEVKYVEIPWLRAIELARTGKIHAIVGAFPDDAPDFYYPKLPLIKMSPNSLFTLKESQWQYDNLRSFHQVQLGIIKGYDYGNLLNSYIKSFSDSETRPIIELSGNDAVKRSLQFLQKGRIDVYVDAEPVFWFVAQQLNMADKVQKVGEISEPEPCFIAFSPVIEQSEQLTLLLDKGVTKLKLSGRMDKIAAKYGLPPSTYQ